MDSTSGHKIRGLGGIEKLWFSPETSQMGEIERPRDYALGEHPQIKVRNSELEHNIRPDHRLEYSQQVQNVATVHLDRYHQTGAPDDLELCIQRFQEALDLSTEGPDRAYLLQRLGLGHFDQYDHTGAPDDIELSIQQLQEALDLTPEGHDRAGLLLHLGLGHLLRYQHTRAPDDMELGIRPLQEAYDLAPEGPDRASRLRVVEVALMGRYCHTGVPTDIELCIQRLQEALNLTPEESHSDRAQQLCTLGTGYIYRYRWSGVLSDLELAIRLYRKALDLAPEDLDRTTMLHRLGVGYRARYRRSDLLLDLELAIQSHQECIDLTPEGHPCRAARLHDLGIGYWGKYRATGMIPDLELCIQRCQEAIDLTPDSDPCRAVWLQNLGIAYNGRHQQTGALDDLNFAVHQFQEVLNHELFPVKDRLCAGHFLFDAYAQAEDWILACNAVSLTVSLIPLLKSCHLERSNVHDKTDVVAELASDGAAIFLKAGKPMYEALQLLEIGRGVIAASISDIRTDTIDLKKRHPQLAEQFNNLRALLNIPIELRRYDQRYGVPEQLEELIQKVRCLPGLDQFLLPLSENEWREAAAHDFIVFVNASKFGCHALIVEQKGFRALELPLLDIKDVQIQAQKLASPGTEMLEWLWDKIASPVFTSLNFIQTPEHTWPRVRRVRWILTGLLARFPIHAAEHYSRDKTPRAANEDKSVAYKANKAELETLSSSPPLQKATPPALDRALQAVRIEKSGIPVEDAINALKGVLSMQKMTFAETNPEVFTTKTALAAVYTLDGQTQKALELLQSIRFVESKILSDTDKESDLTLVVVGILRLAKLTGIQIVLPSDVHIDLELPSNSTGRDVFTPIKLPSISDYFKENTATTDSIFQIIRTTIRDASKLMYSRLRDSGDAPDSSTRLAWILQMIQFLQRADFVQDRLSFLALRLAHTRTTYLVPVLIKDIIDLVYYIDYCESISNHYTERLIIKAIESSMQSAYTKFLMKIHMLPEVQMSLALLAEYVIGLLHTIILLYVHGHSCDEASASCEGNFMDIATHSPRSIIQCYYGRAACLSRLFGDEPIWMIKSQSADYSLADNQHKPETFSIASDIATLDDIWGPISKVEIDGNIVQYNIRSGCIVPWQSDIGQTSALNNAPLRSCHFLPYNLLEEASRPTIIARHDTESSDTESAVSSTSIDEDFCCGDNDDTASLSDCSESQGNDDDIIRVDRLLTESPEELTMRALFALSNHFLRDDILLIGSPPNLETQLRRSKCSCDITSFRKRCKAAGIMRHLSTREEHRSLQLASFGANFSFQGVGLKADAVIKKCYAFLKDKLIDQWEQAKEACNPRQLQVYGAVVMSRCTRNAIRCTILDLFQTASLMRMIALFHDSGQFQEILDQYWEPFLQGNILGILELWDDKPESHAYIIEIISRALRNLKYSGLDTDRKEYNVLWFPDGSHSPARIVFHPERHTWIKTLRDGADTCALSVLSEDSFHLCFDSLDTRSCQEKDRKLRTCLETAIVFDTKTPPFKGKRIHDDQDVVDDDHSHFDIRLGQDWFRAKRGAYFWVEAPLYRLIMIAALSEQHILCQWDSSMTRKLLSNFGNASNALQKGHKERWESDEDAFTIHIRNSLTPGTKQPVNGRQIVDAWVRLLYA